MTLIKSLGVAAFALLSLILPASAWPDDKDFYVIDKSERHPAVRVKAWKRVHKPEPPPPPRVTVSIGNPRCRSHVAAIGDSARSEAAAKLEAQKSWKGVVQFEHGNKYLSLENADGIEYQCSPSSVPKFGGLIENAAGKFLPIESITCRISAQPCAAPVQRDYGGK